MKLCVGKANIVLLLAAASLALSGCLGGDDVDEPTVNSPPGGPSANNPPTISGNPPPAVVVGQNYSFTPNASDPDGDSLTFSIEGQPMWADFNTGTGRLSGVAPLGAEGTYADIRISVSDGDLSAETPQFSIEVTQMALGSATLSWTAPTQNSDGTPLMDLTAYKVYYGTSPGAYTNELRVDNPGTTTFVVENLVPNTYYFVSTSINSSGVESVFSNVASMTVN